MLVERKLAEPVTRLPHSRTTHIPPLVSIDLDSHTLRQHSHRAIERPCQTYGIVSISSQIQSGNRTSKFNTPNAIVGRLPHPIKTNSFASKTVTFSLGTEPQHSTLLMPSSVVCHVQSKQAVLYS